MYNIIVLYTEIMPYNIVVFRELIKRDCRITVVCWDKDLKTSYTPPPTSGIDYYARSLFADKNRLFDFIDRQEPDLIWVSGWVDPLYNSVCKLARKRLSIPIVAGSDTQWQGGKQWLNVLTARFRHRRWFSHICIAGVLQYEYAHRLGFDDAHIVWPNLSADTELFSRLPMPAADRPYPKRLLYMGRFSPEKGLLPLLHAWRSLSDRKGWKLTLIGAGPLLHLLQGYPDVEILPFMPQEELLEHIAVSGGYILPSVFEPWALVLHEAAAAGLPILASERCGAVPYFVGDGQNGYLFTPGDEKQIRDVLIRFFNLDLQALLAMSRKSRELSTCVTPAMVADTLLGVMKKNKL